MTVPNPASTPVAAGSYTPPLPQQQGMPQPQGGAWPPPLRDPEPPKPPRPRLTKEAAGRARRAGAVGGGIAWLGLGITQASIVLLALPAIVAAVVYGLGFAVSGGPVSATGTVLPQLLDWLASPLAIGLIVGIPLGIAVWLLGLWLSTRMLRHEGIARPVGVTWAGFGIAVAANALLGSVGSFTFTPFAGGLPLFGMPGADFDVDRWDGTDFSAGERLDIDPELLERFADPAQLLALASPWVALGTLASLIIPIVIGIFTWWWMAHAMRPRPIEPVEAAAEPEATPAA
ncbi:hypothetical protein [Agrococcus beijingensis]|uniref:hypothetical protein n=1 Tax=Agrococcus beijingensis TaxID=3068634 RepID=UPI002740B6CC|nr:hypothetical protein [Agrococcus sp. REN33]